MDVAITSSTWKEVRPKVAPLNPKLTAILDSIDPSNEYKFFTVRHHFGDELLQRSKLHLPRSDGVLIPYDDPSVPTEIQSQLGYNFGANPVAMLLNNSAELFISLDNRIIPYAVVGPGHVMGAWRILDEAISHCPPTFLWGMTAGARSIFMLPKISKQVAHQRIKKHYHIDIEKPKSIADHWGIFKALSKSEEFGQEWHMDILYFNYKWFENLRDPAWSGFHKYLLESVWLSSSFWRNQYLWEILFAYIRKKRELLPSPQVADLVKHLFSIGVGVIPGFQPAVNNNLAPIDELQKIYVECYDLDHYAPIIMQPSYFSFYEKTAPAYYSMQFPTALELSPKSSKHSTTLSDLYDTGSLIKKYFEELDSEKLHLETTPLGNLAQNVKFDLFHSNTGPYKHIQSCSIVPREDENFLKNWNNTNNNLFPPNSNFFNGCIRIKNKD